MHTFGEYHIRELEQVDMPAFAEFRHKIREEAPYFRPYLLREDLMEIPEEPNKKRFIVLKAEKIIGYCMYYRINSDTAVLGSGILKEYYGKGLGSETMKYLIQRCKDEHYIQIDATVHRENWRALIMDIKLGFKVIGEKDDGILQIRLML